MASPFKHFRKHQRAMLAVVGILCMIGFTIGPSTLDWFGGYSAARDPVVATANGATLRQSNVTHLLQQRNLANQFAQGCMVMAAGNEQIAAYQMLLSGRTPGQFFGPPTEEVVVRTHLLAEEADKLGVVISDETVNRFLRELTGDKVPAEGYATLVKNLKVSQDQIFSALRNELAALQLERMSLPSAPATPAQRWDYYRRLNQRASIEATPVRVAEFVDEVSEPSKEELARFFEAHKEQEPNPVSPTPGFKVPKKAAFQYFTAEYDKFYDESSVTQEEVEKHYELYKDQKYLYSAFESPEFDEPDADKKTEGDKQEGDEKQPAENEAAKPADKKNPDADGEPPAANKPADGEQNDPESTPKPESAPKDDPSAEKEPSNDSPAEERPETPPAEEKSEGGEPAETKASDQSGIQPAALRWIVAMPGALTGLANSMLVAEGDETETAKDSTEKGQPASDNQPPAEEKTADKTDPADTEEPTAKEGAAPPKQTSSDDSESGKKEAEESSPTEPGDAKKAPAGPPPSISDDLLLPRDIREGPKPKYAPLWRVENSIRKELAGQSAVEKMTKGLDAVQLKIGRYRRNLSPDDEFDDEEQPKKRALPDFSELAKTHDLSQHTTELLTAQEFRDRHPELADATPDQSNFSERTRSLLEIAYTALPALQTAVVKDLAGNRYLVWKTDEQEAYVPELSEVRDEVVRGWKMVQARELAQKRAEELAAEARKADKPLKEVFEKRDVVVTPAFSWLTQGPGQPMGSQAPVDLSEVEGIQDAGANFMREVFSLSVGEVGQAMNQPENICYVVRVVSLQPSREVLRTLFMVDPYERYQAAAREDYQEVAQAWLQGLEHEANLSWKRPPNEPQR